MNPADLQALYSDLSPSEFFEAVDSDGVDEGMIDQALGAEVVQEYACWMYLNLK